MIDAEVELAGGRPSWRLEEVKRGGLYPTPTRIGLLEGVEATLVVRDGDQDWLCGGFPMDAGEPTRRKVTDRIAEQREAGWVELVHVDRDYHPYRLTQAGRAVLAAARREAGNDG